MLPFRIHILGCGSALPTLRHNPAAQVVDIHDRLFLVDCGEGTQLQIRRQHIALSCIGHVFISHLHGDHCFGLPGLLTTLSMISNVSQVHIYAFDQLRQLLEPLFDFHLKGSDLTPVFHPIRTEGHETIYEDKSVTVSTLPLRHRVPCVGFLFKEKAPLPHIRRDMIDFLQIPHYAINPIKQGGGWTTADGTFYPHERLVTPNHPPRTYAYISDTLPCPEHIEALRDADLLYHEATFCNDKAQRAAETCHSTAAQAAGIAAEAQVKRLLLGHYSARYTDEETFLDEARPIFPDVQAAQEGMVIELK